MNVNAAVAAPILAAQRVHGMIRLRHLAHLVSRSASGAFPPEWHDLWFLYRLTRTLQPRVVLEFGSGCSTAIFASALAANGSGRIASLESSAEWLDVTRGYLPADLADHCDLVHSPAVESMHDGAPVWRYTTVPPIAADLIYIDGPPLSPERQSAVDVLDLENSLAPGAVIVIDGPGNL